ncbi:unnamed protein product [Merluccius merluccius]
MSSSTVAVAGLSLLPALCTSQEAPAEEPWSRARLGRDQGSDGRKPRCGGLLVALLSLLLSKRVGWLCGDNGTAKQTQPAAGWMYPNLLWSNNYLEEPSYTRAPEMKSHQI